MKRSAVIVLTLLLVSTLAYAPAPAEAGFGGCFLRGTVRSFTGKRVQLQQGDKKYWLPIKYFVGLDLKPDRFVTIYFQCGGRDVSRGLASDGSHR